ncbi:LysR family transcriptional regulator [uncultured Hoeflea sp.]|uniref:LysR family transcriptional regulator n=1 Tax=uncultured Hoeflea sp. TaxID=538666 RepID=UPI0026125E5E|nr:LysR family transcriptional regulator [uncultured Hoeflea sp.]
MNRLPQLSGIAIFVQVAETGAFNEAARRMNLTPSAASKAVTRLEEDLGVRLLRRTTRSVSLTPEGERYLEGARRALAELETSAAEAAGSTMEPGGTLRVSAPSALGRMWLAPALYDFHRQWPKVSIELSLDDRIVDLAGEGNDVVIRSGTLADSASLVARKLFGSQLVLCAAPDYWARNAAPKSPCDLEVHACLNFRNRRTGKAVPWVFDVEGQTIPHLFKGPLTTDDGEAVLHAAVGGLGVSQMPGYMAAEAVRSGALVPTLEAFTPPATQYSAIYLDRRLVAPRIRVFIDFLIARPLVHDADARVTG